MAFPTNTLSTYSAAGNREELANVIYKIAQTMRPFQQNIKKGTCKSTYPEWQKQSLRAPVVTNMNIQGEDTAATAAKTTERYGNRTQIFKECAAVTRTQQAVDAAGRPNEMSYQVLLKGEELLNDMEMSLLANQAANAGNTTTPAQLAGALAWMASNISRGAGGSTGVYAGGNQGAAVNGTTRPFTEALLKSVLASAFGNGAVGPKLALMSAAHKQVFSSFSGIADIRVNAQNHQATIIGAADKYIGDFGELTTVPVQFGLTRDVLIIDPAYWELAYLTPLKTEPLAKTGDSDRKQLVAEATLKALNEKSSAVIADLS
jgi:hypothetical protein